MSQFTFSQSSLRGSSPPPSSIPMSWAPPSSVGFNENPEDNHRFVIQQESLSFDSNDPNFLFEIAKHLVRKLFGSASSSPDVSSSTSYLRELLPAIERFKCIHKLGEPGIYMGNFIKPTSSTRRPVSNTHRSQGITARVDTYIICDSCKLKVGRILLTSSTTRRLVADVRLNNDTIFCPCNVSDEDGNSGSQNSTPRRSRATKRMEAATAIVDDILEKFGAFEDVLSQFDSLQEPWSQTKEHAEKQLKCLLDSLK